MLPPTPDPHATSPPGHLQPPHAHFAEQLPSPRTEAVPESPMTPTQTDPQTASSPMPPFLRQHRRSSTRPPSSYPVACEPPSEDGTSPPNSEHRSPSRPRVSSHPFHPPDSSGSTEPGKLLCDGPDSEFDERGAARSTASLRDANIDLRVGTCWRCGSWLVGTHAGLSITVVLCVECWEKEAACEECREGDFSCECWQKLNMYGMLREAIGRYRENQARGRRR